MIQLILVLIVVGVLLYLVETVIPMDATIKKLIRLVVLVVVGIWLLLILLQILGVADVPLPRLKLSGNG